MSLVPLLPSALLSVSWVTSSILSLLMDPLCQANELVGGELAAPAGEVVDDWVVLA